MSGATPADLHDLIAAGDPFGGRRHAGAVTPLTFQAADGVPLYLALGEADIAGAARALASAWRTLGVRKGDYVLIYDYGTSPVTLFASWCYVPWLRRGAADLLGAVPICNDGLPEFAGRALHVLQYLRPRVTIVDHAHMPILLRRVAENRAHVSDWTELLVVSADEETVPPAEVAAWSRDLGLPVRLLLRAGPALFFAAECAEGALHADPRHYRVGVVERPGQMPSANGEGTLCVTNRFLQGTTVEHYLANVHVSIDHGPCPCGRPGRPLRCLA
jgi:hypothetical protein